MWTKELNSPDNTRRKFNDTYILSKSTNNSPKKKIQHKPWNTENLIAKQAKKKNNNKYVPKHDDNHHINNTNNTNNTINTSSDNSNTDQYLLERKQRPKKEIDALNYLKHLSMEETKYDQSSDNFFDDIFENKKGSLQNDNKLRDSKEFIVRRISKTSHNSRIKDSMQLNSLSPLTKKDLEILIRQQGNSIYTNQIGKSLLLEPLSTERMTLKPNITNLPDKTLFETVESKINSTIDGHHNNNIMILNINLNNSPKNLRPSSHMYIPDSTARTKQSTSNTIELGKDMTNIIQNFHINNNSYNGIASSRYYFSPYKKDHKHYPSFLMVEKGKQNKIKKIQKFESVRKSLDEENNNDFFHELEFTNLIKDENKGNDINLGKGISKNQVNEPLEGSYRQLDELLRTSLSKNDELGNDINQADEKKKGQNLVKDFPGLKKLFPLHNERTKRYSSRQKFLQKLDDTQENIKDISKMDELIQNVATKSKNLSEKTDSSFPKTPMLTFYENIGKFKKNEEMLNNLNNSIDLAQKARSYSQSIKNSFDNDLSKLQFDGYSPKKFQKNSLFSTRREKNIDQGLSEVYSNLAIMKALQMKKPDRGKQLFIFATSWKENN